LLSISQEGNARFRSSGPFSRTAPERLAASNVMSPSQTFAIAAGSASM
jgi:hypothetical protein